MNASSHNLLFFIPDPTFFFPPMATRAFYAFTVAEVALGLLLLALVSWRWHRNLERLALASTVVAGIAWLSCYALTVWVLIVDPTRGSGNIPLPSPFAQFLAWDNLFLSLGGGVLVVFALAHGVLMFRQRRFVASVLIVSLSIYCFLTISWLAYYVFD